MVENAEEREKNDKISTSDPSRVFIVFGRNYKAYNAIRLFIQSLGLSPLGFDEVRNDLGGSPFVGDIIEAGMRRAQAVVVLFTPDEYAALRPSLAGAHDKPDDLARWQSRPNVLFEAGMALMADQKRTILTVLGDVPIASDMQGRHFLRIGNDTDSRAKLRDALSAVGCMIDQKVTNWHNVGIAGDFDACISASVLPEVKVTSPFASSAAKNVFSTADLPIQASSTDRATSSGIVYKAKLTVIFSNESQQTIHVFRPRWITAFDEIGVQSPLRYAYRLESERGRWRLDSWKEEVSDLLVEPGWSFAMWIGLDPSMTSEALEKRRRGARLGTLLVSVGVGGANSELNYSL
jgi:hypothetical protein